MKRDEAAELLAVLAVAHYNLDHRGSERVNAPSWATAELMKEKPMSAVSDLFDPMPDEIAHGTLKGAEKCRSLGELCFACRRAVHVAAASDSRHSAAPRGTSKAAETAKALEAHRVARKKLQAELAKEKAQ